MKNIRNYEIMKYGEAVKYTGYSDMKKIRLMNECNIFSSFIRVIFLVLLSVFILRVRVFGTVMLIFLFLVTYFRYFILFRTFGHGYAFCPRRDP